MFTGLIEDLGTVVQVADEAAGRRLRIRSAGVADGLDPGASVAINGVCQTVTGSPAAATFDVIAVEETLRRTTLGRLRSGESVNLERPLRVGDRLGGHWVSGHVDTTAAVLGVGTDGRDFAFRIELPDAIAAYVVEKGSIAVDGVSLTVGRVERGSFHVHIIPETRERTLFARYRTSDLVNLEADLLAKYVRRALEVSGQAALALGPEPSKWGNAARQVLEAWERGDS